MGPERKQNSTNANRASIPGTNEAFPFWKVTPLPPFGEGPSPSTGIAAVPCGRHHKRLLVRLGTAFLAGGILWRPPPLWEKVLGSRPHLWYRLAFPWPRF